MCGSPGYTIAKANNLIGLLWVKPASKAGVEVLIKKTKGWRAKLIYTFCNTSRGRMSAAGNSSKRLLVCLGAQIVLQANMGKPRAGLSVRERDNRGWRPPYCWFLLSLGHYSGCCPGRSLFRLSTWLVPWVDQGAVVSVQAAAPNEQLFCSGPGGPRRLAQVYTRRATCLHQAIQQHLCSSAVARGAT